MVSLARDLEWKLDTKIRKSQKVKNIFGESETKNSAETVFMKSRKNIK